MNWILQDRGRPSQNTKKVHGLQNKMAESWSVTSDKFGEVHFRKSKEAKTASRFERLHSFPWESLRSPLFLRVSEIARRPANHSHLYTWFYSSLASMSFCVSIVFFVFQALFVFVCLWCLLIWLPRLAVYLVLMFCCCFFRRFIVFFLCVIIRLLRLIYARLVYFLLFF